MPKELRTFLAILLLTHLFGYAIVYQTKKTVVIDTFQRTVIDHTEIEERSLASHEEYRYLPGEASHVDDFVCNVSASEHLPGQWIRTTQDLAFIDAVDPVKFAYGFNKNQTYRLNGYKSAYLAFTDKELPPTEHQRRISQMSYTWTPTRCKLMPFNRSQALVDLSKRKVFIAGDSITHELAFSMSYLTHTEQAFNRSYLLVHPKTFMPIEPDMYRLCRCMESSYWRRNATDEKLLYVDYESCTEFHKPGLEDWNSTCFTSTAEHLKLDKFGWVEHFDQSEVFIFSFGHHIFKAGPLEIVYPQMVRNFIKWVEARNWTGQLIYITTLPHHYRCMEYTEPLTSIGRIADKFKYQFLWRDAFNKSENLRHRAHFLDLSYMRLRPDARMGGETQDCLHWLIPGAIDSWSHLIFHILHEIIKVSAK